MQLTATNVNWDFQPLIQGPKESKTFVAADSLVMFEKCSNKELAAKLMKYITSAEVMSDFHKRVSEQPPITKDETYAGDERYTELFSDYGDNFVSLPDIAMEQVLCMIHFEQKLTVYVLGSMSPEMF